MLLGEFFSLQKQQPTKDSPKSLESFSFIYLLFYKFRGSLMVKRLAVNEDSAGSIPAPEAIKCYILNFNLIYAPRLYQGGSTHPL